MMSLDKIQGNLKELPQVQDRGRRKISTALRSWTIGGVGETIALWALYKARFWRIVKSLRIQYRINGKMVDISSFISPNQLRQGLCWLPSEDERYYRKKILTEEQIKLTYRWDFLALKIHKETGKQKVFPCLIEVKTLSRVEPSDDYSLFKKRDFSKEKEAGFRIFCLRVMLKENWRFEVIFEEL